jgi:hypothetical protein
MLNGVLSLHDVRDTEALCRKVADQAVRRWRWDSQTLAVEYRERRYESLLTYLVEAAWIASTRYDPQRERTIPFSHFLRNILPSRAIDWLRIEDGRTRWQFSDESKSRSGSLYERENIRPLHLLPESEDGGLDVPDPSSDTEAVDWRLDFGRLLAEGDREDDGRDDANGEGRVRKVA